MDENVIEWATAISRHKSNERVIIWRFAKALNPAFELESLPWRVILAWKYESENGQPVTEVHQQMNLLEDLLEPICDQGKFATLALASTGENLREWTYYTRSDDEFVDRLNMALYGEPVFPFEIHTANDPTWSMYRKFKVGVVDKSNKDSN